MDQIFNFTHLITSSSKFSPSTSFVFIALLLFSTALADVDPHYLACVPKSCDDGQIINFPFYIKNQQEPFCGYPGFQLSCNEKGNPVLNLSNNVYIVHQIFYDNQSLRVSDAAVSGTNNNDLCTFPRLQNLSLPDDRFQLAPEQTELVLLYNCNSSLPRKLLQYRVDKCSGRDETRTVQLALFGDNSDLGLASEACTDKVSAPVEKYEEESKIGTEETLSRGFVLQWIASDCSVCAESGGKCGFNESNYHFQCYCPDRPHAKQCIDPGIFPDSLQNLS
ncbi:LEAF RUST 10 DISEASE-RESISTANCE LOCUS RECEPTOR-LIKE PROTEIN KINASE-like 2.1 [Melia azedarach]|uniref:LEAF RUST 10 DISEASE-RESISTANCE LOCUS RECEPTOR-LIKE PROTEIN KINASE-like 2.1 n=1 Tax=Melia azedarach TaxID=155640 RepID=A0ACC1XF25_MELAZ|nr:LEAF RUST 10 DISEASE-RESISTANCE LOCUS RECEPTOR-LIKE PROTEIN KINASE-like 2.1 [Melia azedarach]